MGGLGRRHRARAALPRGSPEARGERAARAGREPTVTTDAPLAPGVGWTQTERIGLSRSSTRV